MNFLKIELNVNNPCEISSRSPCGYQNLVKFLLYNEVLEKEKIEWVDRRMSGRKNGCDNNKWIYKQEAKRNRFHFSLLILYVFLYLVQSR